MPDRLAELVRQRALIEEHLAWLNRQIANATPKSPAGSSPPVAATTLVSPSDPPRAALTVAPPDTSEYPAAPADADEIMAKYHIPSSALKDDVRMGCFLYFAAAMVVLGLGVTLLYLIWSRR